MIIIKADSPAEVLAALKAARDYASPAWLLKQCPRCGAKLDSTMVGGVLEGWFCPKGCRGWEWSDGMPST